MTRFPRGIVTFLGATISPSNPDHHAELIRTAMKAHGGVLFHDDGITIYTVFSAPVPALRAALQAQREIGTTHGDTAPSPAIAVHTGESHQRNGSYFGPTFNRVMSILAAAHPGQIVISANTHDSFQAGLPGGVALQPLGEYRLKDLYRTTQLYQLVAPDLPSQFPPLMTIDNQPHNLPIQDSPLIGREQEVATCATLLRKPHLRLLTLLGSSGMGKTRLAIQVAVEVINDFADGVWFVALAPVNDPKLLVPEIAQTLGVQEQPDQPLLDTLTTFLHEKRLLLVLDNFEQLWSAAPAIIEVLETSQHVKVLVTSQMALELENERVFVVPPLAMPAASANLSIDELSQIPAVALFVERARDVQPNFTLTAAMAPATIELCTRLEGLPLAIELVASQSKRYFPGDMLIMLQNRLSVARATRRGNTREDTLRPVLDWICEVLGAGVAGLFARLGVFVGGCTAESASAICNPTNDLALDVAATLEILLANHVLLREELKEGRQRYTMLDAIHDYAEQRLTRRRELARLQQAHGAYYMTFAEAAEVKLREAERESWVAQLEDEHHNLRAALIWSQTNQPEQMLRLSAALGRFWFMYGYFSEGRRWLESALELGSTANSAARAKGLLHLGLLALAQGHFDQAQQNCEAALPLYRELDDNDGLAMLLNVMGSTAMGQGNYTQAISLYEEGLALAYTLGDPHGIGHYRDSLGTLMYHQGHFEQATAYYEENLRLYDEIGDQWEASLSLTGLGMVAIAQHEYDRAESLLRHAQTRNPGDETLQAQILEGLARIQLAQGDYAAIRPLLSASARIRLQQGTIMELGHILEIFAELRLAEGQPQDAARLMGAAAQHETIGSLVAPVFRLKLDTLKATILSQISQADYDAAWQAGRTAQFDGVIDELLTSPAAQS